MDFLLLGSLLVGEWSSPGSCEEHRSVFTDIVDGQEVRLFYNLEKKEEKWVRSDEYVWWTDGNILYHSKKNSCGEFPVKVLEFSGEKVIYCPISNCSYKFEMIRCLPSL